MAQDYLKAVRSFNLKGAFPNMATNGELVQGACSEATNACRGFSPVPCAARAVWSLEG